jgi:acyl-ACP thioesterase
MTEMPRNYQHCQVSTWVESVMKLFTTRNFAIKDAEGNPMGYARSVWAMIDTETRRPCDLVTLYDGDLLNYVVSDEENVCPIEGHGRFRFREAQLVRTLTTCYSDIDINGHVNSIKYIEHILNLFSRQQMERGIKRFEIAYKAESYMGDTLSFYIQPVDDNEIDVEVRKNISEDSNGDVVCQAKVRFNVSDE